MRGKEPEKSSFPRFSPAKKLFFSAFALTGYTDVSEKRACKVWCWPQPCFWFFHDSIFVPFDRYEIAGGNLECQIDSW